MAVWVPLVVAGASLLSSYLANKSNQQAISSASASSYAAAQQQAQLIQQMYEQNRNDMLPYMQAGQDALTKLQGGSMSSGGSWEVYTTLGNEKTPSWHTYDDIANYNKSVGAQTQTPAELKQTFESNNYKMRDLNTGATTWEVYTALGGEKTPSWHTYEEIKKFADSKGTTIKSSEELKSLYEKSNYQIRDAQNPNYNAMADFTGGAQQYLTNIKNLEFPSFDPTADAQGWLDKLNKITFPEGVDPTGGMQKYMDQLESLEFKLDTNDPIYQWRASENERLVNQFMASRGGYDSRAAANMLLSSGMELQADETERQFNQRYLAKYKQLTDLAGMAYQKGQAEYAAATDKYSSDVSKNLAGLSSSLQIGMDKYNVLSDKYNADIAKNITGFNASMQLGNTNYNQLLDLIKIGTGASSTAGAWGQNTAGQLANVSANQANTAANAMLASGSSNANFWQGVGSIPTNMLMTQYLMKNMG